MVVLDARVVTGAGGGPDKTILNSPRFLLPSGYRMLCAYMRPPDDPGFERLRQRARQLDAPLLEVDDRGPLDRSIFAELLAICRRNRVAIWHGHDYKSNLFGILLRRRWPMRLVTTVHGWVERTWRTPLYFAVDRLTLRRYERVICVSPDLHARCLSAGVPEDRCMLVENGIDVGRYTRRLDPSGAKQKLGLSLSRPVIGAVGRLSPEKGFDFLIHAIDRLRRDGLEADLIIAGEGGQRPELERLVGDLGLGGRVRLLGYHGNAVELYEAMDAFALSSVREGLPNVVLESLAMEVPVVATRIAGVPRLIRHGENGLLVEPGSAAGLAEALRLLLRDGQLADRLRHAGRTTVEAEYSFAARMQTIRSIYDELLGRPADPDLTQGTGRPPDDDASARNG